MTVAIVFESMFGNTQQLADAVASGVADTGAHVVVCRVGADPAYDTDYDAEAVDLVILAAPTHALSLSTHASRAEAVERGAAPAAATTGLRGWLEELDPTQGGPLEMAVFDTRVWSARRLPWSAAHGAARVLRKKHVSVARVTSFYVETVEGPLCPGEIERARAWGRSVADAAAGREPAGR
jgi:hypothetical protein